jgi:Protein of unknown function (DUF1761)
MINLNFYAIALAAAINIIIGFTWYNPKVFGTTWMKEAGLDPHKMKNMNMIKLIGFSILFAFMIAVSMYPMVIHQFHLQSIVMHQLQGTDETAKALATTDVTNFITKYGTEFRDFKHGVIHGLIYTVFLILPIISMNALYENRSWKYIFIHVGYWATCLSLMGGVICSMS